MLKSPSTITRHAVSEKTRHRTRSWTLRKSTTVKDAEKNENKLANDIADSGIYTITIANRKLPLLGTEIGMIPLWQPGKRPKGKEEQTDTTTKAVTKSDGDAGITPPRKIETYIDKFSVAPGYSHDVSSQLSKITSGLTFNPNDHPLLCDLDEDRDAVMYGRGKEFVENIKRVRTLLVEFHKWELTERWYKAVTLILKFSVAMFLYIIWYQTSVTNLLKESFALYSEHIERSAGELEARRNDALRRSLSGAEAALASPKINAREEASKAQIYVRRELLPDSGDLATVVKARMKAYHEEKHRAQAFPS